MKSNFENLDVWKKSCRLTVNLHELLKETNSFWIKDQILRSALSIPSNIAEGCDRNSTAEFRRFVNIAKGSAAEEISAPVPAFDGEKPCQSKRLVSIRDNIALLPGWLSIHGADDRGPAELSL